MDSTTDILDTSSGGFAQSTKNSDPRHIIIYGQAEGPHVFVTARGAIGMEVNGRITIKTIESWIAMAWHDIPSAPRPSSLQSR